MNPTIPTFGFRLGHWGFGVEGLGQGLGLWCVGFRVARKLKAFIGFTAFGLQ